MVKRTRSDAVIAREAEAAARSTAARRLKRRELEVTHIGSSKAKSRKAKKQKGAGGRFEKKKRPPPPITPDAETTSVAEAPVAVLDEGKSAAVARM